MKEQEIKDIQKEIEELNNFIVELPVQSEIIAGRTYRNCPEPVNA
jgi:hypothetical protein